MHCPGSGKRHWEGRARASFCLLRWRTGGCSLVYDEEQWFCLVVVLYSHFLSFLSFRTHDDIRVFWTLGEFRAWEASTWNVLMSIMDLEEHFIFTTATRSRAQRQRIRTNAEKPWLGNIRQRLSLADDQTDEVEWLARFLNSRYALRGHFMETCTNKIWDLNFTRSLEPSSNLIRPSLR